MKTYIIFVSVKYPTYRRVVIDVTEEKCKLINEKLLSLISQGKIQDFYIVDSQRVKLGRQDMSCSVYAVNDDCIIIGCLGKFVDIKGAIEYCELYNWTWKHYTGDRSTMVIARKELHIC